MPIRPLLYAEGVNFDPNEVEAIASAFEMTLARLRLKNRKDPLVLKIAKDIIQAARGGERDPDNLCEKVLRLYRANPK